MNGEHKDIFFHGRTHAPHPHNLGLTGLLSQTSPQACGVAGLKKTYHCIPLFLSYYTDRISLLFRSDLSILVEATYDGEGILRLQP